MTLISDSKLSRYASKLNKRFITQIWASSDKIEEKGVRDIKKFNKESKNAYQNVFLINSIVTELFFRFYHLLKPCRHRINGIVHILLFDVILNDVRNAVT